MIPILLLFITTLLIIKQLNPLINGKIINDFFYGNKYNIIITIENNTDNPLLINHDKLNLITHQLIDNHIQKKKYKLQTSCKRIPDNTTKRIYFSIYNIDKEFVNTEFLYKLITIPFKNKYKILRFKIHRINYKNLSQWNYYKELIIHKIKKD